MDIKKYVLAGLIGVGGGMAIPEFTPPMYECTYTRHAEILTPLGVEEKKFEATGPCTIDMVVDEFYGVPQEPPSPFRQLPSPRYKKEEPQQYNI